MKKLNLFLLLVILTSLSAFSKKSERILIKDKITIDIPTDFEIHKDTMDNRVLIIAESDVDKFFIAKHTDSSIELDPSELEEILIKNLKGFIRGVNGNKLGYTDFITQNDLIQSTFSFEIEKPELMIGYGKIIFQESSMIFLTYLTKSPANDQSLKIKDKIYKSLKIE